MMVLGSEVLENDGVESEVSENDQNGIGKQ